MRSLVCWGMESATLDRLMTKETVAGERPRCSANFLRLTGRLGVRAGETGLELSVDGLDLRVATLRSLA
jgi:hypothetical protein